MPVEQKQECPFCAELILARAKKCKHCGETLDVALRAAEEARRAASASGGGGGGGGAASSTVVIHGDRSPTKSFPHFLHLVVTIITMGLWFPIWILHYIVRDCRVYG